ncbi:hypothetical protein MKX08_003920 [Trichoderma sp. CBMAI-0020]|nr:hypothetical protein MKX08_003920 [Trichoderma sp. CBMAI-0020]
MTLTQEHKRIIAQHPLNETLDLFRDKLRCANDANDADDTGQEDIATILLVLVGSMAAFNLRAPDSSINVAERLFPIFQRFRGGTVQSHHFRPLIRCVIDKATDVDLWEAVFAVIDNLSAIIPSPSSIVPTFQGTPIKVSSSRLNDNKTRDIVERELFFETKDCTFRNVGGFFDKFFNLEGWSAEQKSITGATLYMRRATFAPYDQNRQPVRGAERPDGPFFEAPVANATLEYKNVLVVGEQKKSYDRSRFKADLLQLTRHVRGVFSDQPTRRFVHAFSLCASTKELWAFDRSGPYSSGPFNIRDEPDKFARAFVGYTTMDDDAMGLDTFMERSGGHRYLNIDDINGEEKIIRLDKAMVRRRAIVCRGTTCYRTRNGHVAKLSWVPDKQKLEVEQLKQAEQRGVRGVARAVAHRQITSIASIREGLDFSKPHRFRDEILHFEGLQSTVASTRSLGIKRKLSSDHTSINTSEAKRRRCNNQKSTFATELNGQLLVSKPKPSLYTTGKELWENRIYSCLVVSPAGRVISDFRTIKELLESMRDAIKAHQSLYTTGNILHRDISSNNIIITDPEVADGFKGMLIDLDLAKENNSGPSGARHQTGTMQFMAIEVLCTVDHTYRHDLESFFYVLIWMCARQSWHNGFIGGNPPRESRLRNGEIGSFRDIADVKMGHMAVNGLEHIMSQFPETLGILKPLCLKIRKVLFPLDKCERVNFGTPTGDPAQLYKPIIAAYDESISALWKLHRILQNGHLGVAYCPSVPFKAYNDALF